MKPLFLIGEWWMLFALDSSVRAYRAVDPRRAKSTQLRCSDNGRLASTGGLKKESWAPSTPFGGEERLTSSFEEGAQSLSTTCTKVLSTKRSKTKQSPKGDSR